MTKTTGEVVSHHDVVIVGAGIAGLSAAYYLRDCNVRVLEESDCVGGRAISGTYQGFSYAKGAEYLGKPEGSLAEIIKALRIEPKEIPSPMDARFHRDKFYYGEHGTALMHIEESSLADYNRFVSTIQRYYRQYEDLPDFDATSDLARLDEITVREWFDMESFPATFYEAYNVAARGLFGATIDEISALGAIPEFGFDFEGSKPIESVSSLENVPEQGGRSGAYSFLTGISEVTDAIAQQSGLGDRVLVNSTVTEVTQEAGRYLVTYTDEKRKTRTLASKVVILATPAPVALRIASEALSKEQKEIMEQIPYAMYATAALFSEEPIFGKAFDLAVPDGYFFTDVYDETWVQRYYDPSLRERKAHVTGVYIAPERYRDRTLPGLSDEAILERVYRDLERILPGVQGKVVGYDIQRFAYAYPVMTLGAYKRLSRLRQVTKGDLLLAGDYTIYPTFEAAADSGHLAAQEARRKL